MNCPYLNKPCTHSPECTLREGLNKVDCVEWVKKERRLGFKLAGETPPSDLNEERGI